MFGIRDKVYLISSKTTWFAGINGSNALQVKVKTDTPGEIIARTVGPNTKNNSYTVLFTYDLAGIEFMVSLTCYERELIKIIED